MFRLSSDKTPLTFVDGVPQETEEGVASFFAESETRSEKNKLRQASLIEMRNQRDEICKLIGFQDYESYWSSPFWKRIRLKILKRDKRICLRCEGKATQVHHRNYALDVLKGEDDSKLVSGLASVCDGCHNVVHRDDWGDERSIDEWDAILLTKNLRSDWLPFNTDQPRRDRLGKIKHPAWKRMSSIQRSAWTAQLNVKCETGRGS
jgi:hypothetical protein